MEEFHCDIAHILQNRDFTVLQKLLSHSNNFRAKISAKIEDTITHEIECKEKRTLHVNRISELKQEIDSLKSEIDATKLQQKIVDKKIFNAIKQQEELKEKVNNEKSKRDSLCIEMVDLQQESEKRRENKILTWNAIKRACHIYKQYLDVHVQLLDTKECEHIRISFFTHNEDLNNKYFVNLYNSSNQWKVEEVQPEFKKEDFDDFKGIVDFSAQSEIFDITAFLCKLRHIFIKCYYY
ncbi:PREDICTED: uncharacterized protein LOC107192043 [Dufourea novaeangliae]|uniref:uncharacterized protein LOC107192043 n=1 Tax=Dufourea novaeangliae TaxID=178035 RepID=UPI00076743F3|nr:PREDICTED: uncharacterized protein LOC107192043 [Dufourea novaeangliae]